MHVKSITLRGFKSFASVTALGFEPGITCVVGPNGSGKSNIVDAFSWVMGEQGAKSLRGGKMEDVVFAGTASRPALGRAEVALTIDNSDGALPIDYTEVTISRLLFRSGQSEYAINGNHCRLLDVQELLSDSGLGREMHVIVSQGQLDEVLHAGPEARRALIEEAAGVLKHRRRKEKALRKLEAMQANLTRLVDLTAELRRRLGPLGRQAAIARRAAVIAAEARDARLRLLADDYVTGSAAAARGEVDGAAAAARRSELERVLAQAQLREGELDAGEQEHAPRLARAQDTWFSLAALGERLRGLGRVAQERYSHLVSDPEPLRAGRDPGEIELEAAALREQEAVLGELLEDAREKLAAASGQRQADEERLAAAERRLAARHRAEAERAERLARLRGQVEAARSRLSAAEEEAERLGQACDQARLRADQAERAFEEFGELSSGRDDDRAALAARHDRASEALAVASAAVAEIRAAERRANGERAALAARRDALEEGIRAVQEGADASAALLADPDRSPDILGAVASLLTVSEGAQEAITAALGGAADSVAVASLDAAVSIIGRLKKEEAGSAGLVIAGPGAPEPLAPARRLPPPATAAIDLVRAPAELSATLAGLLRDVAVVDDLAQAHDLVRAHPDLRVVTRDGDLLGAHWAQGGSTRPPSALAIRASADETLTRLRDAEQACEVAAEQLAGALAAEERARQDVAGALADRQEADEAATQVSGRLGRLAGAARAAREEASRLETAIAAARDTRERDHAALAVLAGQLTEAEAGETGSGDHPAGNGRALAGPGQRADSVAGRAAGDDDGGAAAGGSTGPDDESSRDDLAARAAAARDALTEARLELRTAEERVRAIAGRADALAAVAERERHAQQVARQRRREREQQARLARAVARGAELALERLTRSLALAAAQREAAEEASRGRAGALKQVRAQIKELTIELDTVVDQAHGAELARAEQRMRLEQIAARAADEFGVDVAALVAEYGPGVPVPSLPPDGSAAGPGETGGGPAEALAPGSGRSTPADAPDRPTTPYVRGEQERRAAAAQRQLDKLGRVNPLALEEFAALEERHSFLAAQLEDLKKTRRDLLTVIKELDDRVQQVFASAFEDTAREFEHVFAALFPGGEGRLILTEPDDMLATGIDVEARPPGKKVKRLSLLSGGERSMTAIAYLVAIFKARPSPFYVLDEVEAALDDINLQRLLGVFAELRESSQLIIVTHQKRTMEVADVLYGITMRGDGVSTVVGQRLCTAERA